MTEISGVDSQAQQADKGDSRAEVPNKKRGKKAAQPVMRRVGGFISGVTDRIVRPSYITLPDEYRKYLGGEEHIKREDFIFFEQLLGKYGLTSEGERGSEGEKPVEFGEAEFFQAVADIKEYGLGLNKKSNERFQLLSKLFLHHKRIRGEYLQVHAKKMGIALPDFAADISKTDFSDCDKLETYLEQVGTLINNNFRAALSQFNNNDIVNLGTLIYAEQTFGLVANEELAVTRFAVNGSGTFTDMLKIVLEDAIQNGKDVGETIRHEFLDRDGIAFQLMRMHISNFSHVDMVTAMQGGDIGGVRTLLEKQDYNSGTCPAILKTTSSDGTQVQRPIAYEYAATIAKNIPPDLLKKPAAIPG